MDKGEATRNAILRQALDLSSEVGLEGLTIGMLAKRMGMSKSGLYAHFQSKEEMQSQVLDAAADRFTAAVLSRALKRPRGVPRLRRLFELWLDWISGALSGGCPFVAAATELDDRSGPVRDTLVGHQRGLLDTVAHAARISVQEGHFSADLDVDQFAFELWGILLGYHHYARLIRSDDARSRATGAFEGLLIRSAAAS